NEHKPQDENKLIAQRREKLHALRERGNAFPNDFRRSALPVALQAEFADMGKDALAEAGRSVTVAGRVIRIRGPFMVLQEGSGQIQLYLNLEQFGEDKTAEIKSWDLGDIVGASGDVFRTDKGELSIRVSDIRLLTKDLRPLPDKY